MPKGNKVKGWDSHLQVQNNGNNPTELKCTKCNSVYPLASQLSLNELEKHFRAFRILHENHEEP